VNVPLTAAAFGVKVVAAAGLSFAGAGAGMLKVPEVTPVRLPEVKLILAPVTAAALVAVRSVKVAVPETPALGVVPPMVQVPTPTAAVTEAVLMVALPYWS
jgi:hypothetical protein